MLADIAGRWNRATIVYNYSSTASNDNVADSYPFLSWMAGASCIILLGLVLGMSLAKINKNLQQYGYIRDVKEMVYYPGAHN